MTEWNYLKRTPAEGYRIAIVNPLTLVGKELASILGERNFPYSNIALIDTAGDEEGTLTDFDGAAAVVVNASDEAFEALDLVFFTGPGEKNEPWLGRHHEMGFVAIDLSQPAGLHDEGIPMVAGVNDDKLNPGAGLYLSAHPMILPVALILHRLDRAFPVDMAAATITRPASEFGQKGIDELFQQTVQTLNLQSIPTEVFDRPTAFTAYVPADARMIEAYASAQLQSILGTGAPVSLMLQQGALFHAHLFSLFVVLQEPAEEAEVRALLEKAAGLEMADPEQPWSTLDAAGKDDVLIGRVSSDLANTRAYFIWAASDNLRRSSALNAALIAEELVARFGPKPN